MWVVQVWIGGEWATAARTVNAVAANRTACDWRMLGYVVKVTDPKGRADFTAW